MLPEELDRADVGAEKAQVPFGAIKISHRNSGIVLHNHVAVIEDEIPDLGETLFKHEIRGRLEKARAYSEVAAEIHEARTGINSAIGDIGRKVIKHLGVT